MYVAANISPFKLLDIVTNLKGNMNYDEMRAIEVELQQRYAQDF